MTLDPAVNTAIDALDVGPDDSETLLTTWLAPILPDGQVASARLAGDPLPFVEVHYMDGKECLEESHADDVVTVHCMYAKGLGQSGRSAAKQFGDLVHRRVLLLGRYLDPITVGSHVFDVEYVEVFMAPQWTEYGDDQILRRTSRYKIGQSYTSITAD